MPRRRELGSLRSSVVPVAALLIGLLGAMVGPAAGWRTTLQAGSAVRAAEEGQGATTIEIGSGPLGDTAMSLVGVAETGEEGVRLFGYLTKVIGLEPSLLATEPGSPTAATARFTFDAEVPDARPVELGESGEVAAITGEGTLAFYLDETGGAAFDEPSSFTDGTLVAEADLTFSALLHRSPAGGSLAAEGAFTQTAAEAFALDGDDYRFGQIGVGHRLRLVGVLAAAEATAAAITGTSTVAERAVGANDGLPASLAGSVGVLAEASCGEIGFWTLGTQVRLARASGNIAAVVEEGVGNLSASRVRGLAAEITSLAAAQQSAAVPADAVSVNRLAATALSTTGRGLGLLAAALAVGDDEQGAAARAIIADGEALLNRAAGELPGVGGAADCDE